MDNENNIKNILINELESEKECIKSDNENLIESHHELMKKLSNISINDVDLKIYYESEIKHLNEQLIDKIQYAENIKKDQINCENKINEESKK